MGIAAMTSGDTRALIFVVFDEHSTTKKGVVVTGSMTGQQVQVNPGRTMTLCVKIHQINKVRQQQVSIDKVIDPLVGRTAVDITGMSIGLVATEKHLKIFRVGRVDGLVAWKGSGPPFTKFFRIPRVVFEPLVLKRV
jgi:hypothetical protein